MGGLLSDALSGSRPRTSRGNRKHAEARSNFSILCDLHHTPTCRSANNEFSTNRILDYLGRRAMRISAACSADPVSGGRSAATTRDLDDTALLRRIAEGDGAAMRSLFTHYRLYVYRFLLRLLNNAALAEDLTSEVFLEVWRQCGQFEGRSTVATWVLAIARNKALASIRRQRRSPFDDAEVEAIEDPADSPEMAVQKIDRSRLLRQVLADLPVKHREIIDLVYYHEKSVHEVATILGIPNDTAKTRLFYARKHIAKLLKEACVDRAWL
jgi:RNA polymerase sigma-70 factor (ECF subfamily)